MEVKKGMEKTRSILPSTKTTPEEWNGEMRVGGGGGGEGGRKGGKGGRGKGIMREGIGTVYLEPLPVNIF